MANMTYVEGLPPLPEYTLKPLPPLLSCMSDKLLVVVGPIVVYWAFSMLFHWIDVMDYFPQYRLHTPAEILKRNRASRWDVVRDVVIQQIVQVTVGFALTMFEPDEYIGKEEYDIAVWAQRIRMAQSVLPRVLSLLGVDVVGLGKSLSPRYPVLAGAVLGGQYPSLRKVTAGGAGMAVSLPQFAMWELALARLIYNVLMPAIQYLIAIIWVDTWQYFLHRGMHMNKWVYTKFHSHHHRLYVPYAYGALYNHPLEGFVLDTVGASIAYKIAGMNTRQGLIFFSASTMKTVDDHCGYKLPFDPLQHLTSNNAGYHDVHHQSWGIKSNFSQPFFTFWDRFFETKWTGGDVSAKYERSRIAAQKAVDLDNEKKARPEDTKTSENPADLSASPSQSPRKRALSSKSINGLRDRVTGSMSCGTGMIGVNGNR